MIIAPRVDSAKSVCSLPSRLLPFATTGPQILPRRMPEVRRNISNLSGGTGQFSHATVVHVFWSKVVGKGIEK